MESITKFLDPKSVPDVTGDELDVEKELAKQESDLEDTSDTVEVNLSDKTKTMSVKDVVLPGKKESDEDAGAVADQAAADNKEGAQPEDTEKKSDKKSDSDEKAASDDSADSSDSAEEKSAEAPAEDEKETESASDKSEDNASEKADDKAEDSADEKEPENESVNEDADEPSADTENTDTAAAEQENQVQTETDGLVDHGESDLDADQEMVPLLKLVSEYDFKMTKVYETPNGAKLINIKSLSDLCMCAFDFHVGSFMEDDSNRGISHLLEHLMFNGCPGISSLEFNSKMDKLGMHVNAFTDRLLTSFHFEGLKANFIPAFDLYYNLVSSFTPTQEIVDKERGVVLNEIGVYNDNPWSVLSETIHEQAYRQHPITYPILGYEDVIRNISVDQVREWYDTNYNAKNLTVYLVGDFSEEDLVYVANKLQVFRDGVGNSDPVITDAMAMPFYKNVIAHKEGITQTLIDSAVPFKNEAFNYYELQVLANVLGGSMSSYLWNEFREERSIAYSVGAYCASMDPAHLMVHCYAGLNNADDAELAKDLFKSAFSYARAISEDDFNKGLNIALLDSLTDQETQSGLLSIVRDSIYFGFDLDSYVATLKNLTYDSYQSFAESVDPEKMVTGILYPLNVG